MIKYSFFILWTLFSMSLCLAAQSSNDFEAELRFLEKMEINEKLNEEKAEALVQQIPKSVAPQDQLQNQLQDQLIQDQQVDSVNTQNSSTVTPLTIEVPPKKTRRVPSR
jgi:hypothetical protein